jgi:hypothetical protein
MNLPQNAGLGAMMQAKGASGAGATKQSMNEMMARAQKLPDSELADVLAGRSVQVPQFAAMLAAMGRDSLRTAVAGAQAGQAKKPSSKDQMLAKMSPQSQAPAGLDVLPAENMETVSAAEGGIIAFSAGDPEGVKDPDKQTPAEKAMAEYIRKIQESSLFNRQGEPSPSTPSVYETDPQARADREAISSFGRKAFDLTGSVVEAPFKAIGTASDYLINRPLRAAGVPIPRVPSQFRYGAEEPKVTTAGDASNYEGIEVPPKAGATPPPKTGVDKTGADQTGGAPRGTAPGVAPTAVPAFESRRSAIDQLLAPTEDIAKQVASSKNQAQGEFLMQMGAALMSTPNVGVALSKGVAAGLPGLAANRKEINAIQKDQRDYRLNLSKAQEAAAQGRDDLAFKYADLAEKAKYHAGMIGAAMARSGAGDSRVATAAMNKAQDQLKLAMGDPRQRRNLGTVEAQQAFLNNAFQSNLSILSGQGPVTPSIPTYGAPPSGAVTRE